MKFLIIGLSLLMSVSAFANLKQITPMKEIIDISGVETVVTVGKGTDNQTEFLHKIIVVDNGLSTDYSPRYGVYYAYKMISEMANPSVIYYLGNAVNYKYIRRESAGVYSIDVTSYEYGHFIPKTLTINVGKIQQEVASQIEEFADGPQGDSLQLTPLTLKTTLK